MSHPRGTTLLIVMVFGSIAFVLMVLGLLTYALFEHRTSMHVYRRDAAFHVAEAGINYYRWHLAHNTSDFTDGTGLPGPYVHTISDKTNAVIGEFSLTISSPLPNSSVIAVASTGSVQNGISDRTLRVRLGFPSFTDSAFIENADMSFSATTQVFGEVMSNGGIKFDGTTDSWVKSAKNTYTYNGQVKPGVWGTGGPQYYWQFPVPAADFGSVSADLSELRTAAQNGGRYFPPLGNDDGYQLVFNNTQYTVYRVTATDCFYLYDYDESRWRRRCYDIRSKSLLNPGNSSNSTFSLPANGVIFVEENVWLEGTVDGRVTIGTGSFPIAGSYNVFIPNNLLQKEKSSDDVIGIITQGDIVIPYKAPNNLEINAAALSQTGQIYMPNYNYTNQSLALKNSLTFFGSQISYRGGGWKYVTAQGQVVAGYVFTNHVYDGNLKYYPPPGFPTGSTYELISWEEVQ